MPNPTFEQLVEKGARIICCNMGGDCENEKQCSQYRYQDRMRELLSALAPAIRAAERERCAKAANAFGEHECDGWWCSESTNIAAAIRALTDEADGTSGD